MTIKVAIRADASIEIGSGHIARCLALADELKTRGASVLFVSRDVPGNLCDFVAQKGFLVARLSQQSAVDVLADAAATRAAIASELGGVDWLIVDHYALDANWERAAISTSQRLLVIDDLANRDHCADILLDQNFYPDASRRYQSRVTKNTTMLLGPRFALMRPEFSQAREAVAIRDGRIRRVAIFFGGTDPTDETTKALQVVQRLNLPDVAIDVVVGRGNPRRDAVRALCESIPNASYFCQVDNMAELLANADLALGAGGVSNWERCCVGVPGVVIAVADNQIECSAALGNIGASLYLGVSADVSSDALECTLRSLFYNPSWVAFVSKNSFALVDGMGVSRVANCLFGAQVVLCAAVSDDSQLVWSWRNAEPVRCNSFSNDEISWADHVAWYTASLAREDRQILIGSVANEPVGVVRFDFAADRAVISIYLAPDRIGAGLGASLLSAAENWLRQNRPHTRELRAEVLAVNLASNALFQRAGYQTFSTCFTKEL